MRGENVLRSEALKWGRKADAGLLTRKVIE